MLKNRILKYILIGLLTILLIRYIPDHALDDNEIIAVAMCVSIGYAVMDKMLPSY
jgi:hypothetical protein